MNFLILGTGGMAGHTTAIYLGERGHTVTAMTRTRFPYGHFIQGDVKDVSFLKGVLAAGDYDVIVNCVGILNKDAEKDKSLAVWLNGFLPHLLNELTRGKMTRVIHISTDCVFSGKEGKYRENSPRDGETFYDRSKALGELENEKDLTFRTSLVGPDLNRSGIGLFNWFMAQRGSVNGYSRTIWTGVTTIELARAIEQAALSGLAGLYHLVNSTPISKYNLLALFNEYFKNGELDIIPDPDVVMDKSLVNSRTDFPFQVPSYRVMVEEMKSWVEANRALYPHYFDISREQKEQE